jgi:hypothetical protein
MFVEVWHVYPNGILQVQQAGIVYIFHLHNGNGSRRVALKARTEGVTHADACHLPQLRHISRKRFSGEKSNTRPLDYLCQ